MITANGDSSCRLLSVSSTITEALARLDADIAAAEAHLAGLRRQKDGVLAFVEQYMTIPFTVADSSKELSAEGPIRVAGSGQSATIHDIVERRIERDFTIEGLDQLARSEGHDFTREQINNAVTYLRRRKFVEKRPGRGNWRRVPSRDGSLPAGQTLSSTDAANPQTPRSDLGAGVFPRLDRGGAS